MHFDQDEIGLLVLTTLDASAGKCSAPSSCSSRVHSVLRFPWQGVGLMIRPRSERSTTAGSASSVGGIMTSNLVGHLFSFGDRQVAFRSGPAKCRRYLVFVGDPSAGFMHPPYVKALQQMLEAAGWCLVQVQLSSSNGGYGTCDVWRDADELDALMQILLSKKATRFVMMGHASGCLSVVHYAKHGRHASDLNGVVLQAPFSIRESQTSGDSRRAALVARHMKYAEDLVMQGKGHHFMPRDVPLPDDHTFPIEANRFRSLFGRLTDDDIFSSDLQDGELEARLGAIAAPKGVGPGGGSSVGGGRPVLVVGGSADAHVPLHVHLSSWLTRLARCMGVQAEAHVIDGADTHCSAHGK